MIKKIFTLLCLCVLCIGSAWGDGTLISNLSDITEGNYYIAALNSETYYTVPNTTISGQTFTCTEGAFSNNTLTPASDAGEFVFTKVSNVDNAFYIYNTNLNKYLVATGSKKFGYVDKDATNYGYWTFSTVTSGGFSGQFSVKHSNTTHYMRAYSNSVRCYDGTSNNGVYLFKKGNSDPTVPSINASNVTIDADATTGEIAYTITNPVDDETLTATSETSWISNIQVGAEKVTFSTEINTGTEERVGHITLAYEGATDKVISVTQNKAIPTYASLDDLINAGKPSATETTVKVTLTNVKIVDKASSYIIVNSGIQDVKIYKSGCPSTWEVNGTVSGTITCPWLLYAGTDWELKINSWEELTYNEPVVTKYAITIDPDMVNGTIEAKLNGNVVDKAAEGKEITLEVTPDDGYRLKSNTLIVVDENVEEVTLDGDKFTMPASEVLVSAEFETIPTHTVKFFVNGEQFGETQIVKEGASVDFPTDPEKIGAKAFMGWSVKTIEGTTDIAPTFVKSATVGTSDLNYYAVFATSVAGEDKTVKFDATSYSANTTYTQGTHEDNAGNTWTYYASMNNQSGTMYFGINSNANNYNIGSPEFAGNVSAISLKAYNGSSTENRKIFICSTNTNAQPTSGDISEVTITKLEKFTTTYNIDLSKSVPFKQFYIYSAKALGVSEVNVTYSSVTYSDYCTFIPAEVTITAAKYATLGLPYAVTIPKDVSAYTATVDGNTVTLSKINKSEGGSNIIPANCGVVLYADVNKPTTYTFYGTTTDESYNDNKLVAVIGDIYYCENYGRDYYLGKNTDGKVTFIKLAQTGNIPAGKAYLKLDAEADAKLEVTFNDEPTGIKDIQGSKMNTQGSAYNLNGVRVNENYKGIVIMNGKKYINK